MLPWISSSIALPDPEPGSDPARTTPRLDTASCAAREIRARLAGSEAPEAGGAAGMITTASVACDGTADPPATFICMNRCAANPARIGLVC